MPTYTELKIEKIDTGTQANQWGDTTNENWEAICAAVTGTADVTFSDADLDITLSTINTPQTARNLRLNLTGTATAARNLFFTGAAAGSGACIEKFYVINNTLSYDITVRNKIAGTPSGNSIVVPALKTTVVFNTSTNFVDAITHLSSLTLGSALPVASGGTGAATLTANSVVLGNGTSALSGNLVAPGSNGNVLTSNGTTWTSAAIPAGGDVVGPASSTDNAIARFDSTTGKLLQDSSGAIITDSWNLGLGITPTSKIHAYEASSSAILQLENGNTSPTSGTDLGAIHFVSNDSSVGANGPRVKLVGDVTSGFGEGRFQVITRKVNLTEFSPLTVDSYGVYLINENKFPDGYGFRVFGTIFQQATDTTTDVNITSPFGGSSNNAFYYMDAAVVGVYDPFPSTGARLWKRWQQGVWYDGANYTLQGAVLIGTAYNSDGTNFPAGAVNAAKVQTIVSSTQVLLRVTNRTTPAPGSFTYWSYDITIRSTV